MQILIADDDAISRRLAVHALGQPPGFELRELIATPSTEPSWP